MLCGRAASAEGINLARLVSGSEGTLALVLQAVLRTVALPAAQAVVVLPFVRLADAAIRAEIAWQRNWILQSATSTIGDCSAWRTTPILGFHGWIDEAAESVLIVEFESDGHEEVAGKARLLIERITRKGLLKAEPVTVFRRADCELLVALRRLTEPLLMKSRSQARPLAIVDDLAVPPDRLASVLRQLQDLLKRHGVMWTMNAYAGDGRIRLRPFLDLADPGDRARLEPLARGFMTW